MRSKAYDIIIILISLLLIFAFVVGSYHYEREILKPEPKPLEVVDKCEVDGKCYIETWIEVTPEDYIGLDIGDEFERSIEK